MNIKLIDNQIARCEGQIQSLNESLPYAEGQSYREDSRRIAELRTELAQWQELRAEVVACDEFRISSHIHQANRELAEQQRDTLLAALKHARQFIFNGIDLGYILMPDADTPDTAHDTLPKIDAAIAIVQGGAA